MRHQNSFHSLKLISSFDSLNIFCRSHDRATTMNSIMMNLTATGTFCAYRAYCMLGYIIILITIQRFAIFLITIIAILCSLLGLLNLNLLLFLHIRLVFNHFLKSSSNHLKVFITLVLNIQLTLKFLDNLVTELLCKK